MKISRISLVAFALCVLSLFVLPRSLWTSFDSYCSSLTFICIVAIVFFFIGLFPIFGKNQIKRFIVLVAICLGLSTVVSIGYTRAEVEFGFVKTWIILGILALISFIGIILTNKKFGKEKS